MSKIACIIPVSNAWPDRGVSAIKIIKTNKQNTLKRDGSKALLMVSTNDPKSGIPSNIKNDKTSSKSIWKRNL